MQAHQLLTAEDVLTDGGGRKEDVLAFLAAADQKAVEQLLKCKVRVEGSGSRGKVQWTTDRCEPVFFLQCMYKFPVLLSDLQKVSEMLGIYFI